MMLRRFFTIAFFPAFALAAHADSIPSLSNATNIAQRIRVSVNELALTAASLSFENPALTPTIREFSLGDASAGYSRIHQSQAVNPQDGIGYAFGSISADAYIKSGNSSFTGYAGYLNGVVFDMQWNESADLDRVFPYVIADAVGGNMRRERYAFSGCYSHEYSRILWGIDGGYTADLYYRKVDPRPKTLTGLLHLKGGVAVKIFNRYLVGASAVFEKFRQSTDIDFISEMGESKIYHLTGLGTFYSRFAGVGKTVYNDEYSIGAVLNLFPRSRNGFFVTGKYVHSSLDHVIVDLNRLPMADMSVNVWQAQAGYLVDNASCRWAVTADFSRHTRRGNEGIFGDPLSGSYPLIGKMPTYAFSSYDGTISGRIGKYLGKFDLRFSPSVGFSHCREEYLEPPRSAAIDNYWFALSAGGDYSFSSGALINLDLGFSRRLNSLSSLFLPPLPNEDEETQSLERATRAAFRGRASSLSSVSLSVRFVYPVSNAYALGVDCEYVHENYGIGIIANNFTTSLSFFF
ncbi:MAG: hypothetical protein NC328_06725 [Muribaculum sp.]|nr:hypothetical protein [Muribaculum sp.]